MKLFRTLGFLLVSLALPASLALADENPGNEQESKGSKKLHG